jgi:hypothetical protein
MRSINRRITEVSLVIKQDPIPKITKRKGLEESKW